MHRPTISRTRLPLLALLATIPLADCAARGYGGISNVIPVAVTEGTTLVPRFAPDGREAMVVEARMPGAAQPSLMALLPRQGGWRPNGRTDDGWDLVAMPDPQAAGMSAAFNPRGGTAVFARAKVGGIPATLLLAAVPDGADPQPLGQPRRMTLLTYQLDTGSASASFQHDHHAPLLQPRRRAGRAIPDRAARRRRPLPHRQLSAPSSEAAGRKKGLPKQAFRTT